MGEAVMDSDEVIIIGAGICGLATALALHKKGIKSLVIERSENLRNTTGTAIGIRQNGWRALDQLGVADHLRRTAFPIMSDQMVFLDGKKQQAMSMKGESRSLKRKDLIDTLYTALPPATVKFGCELESIKLDPKTSKPVLQFIDGTSIIPKAVIGCEGGKSIVAEFLNLKPTKKYPLRSVRGLTNYPNGHSFEYELNRYIKDNKLVGRIPIDDKLVYWFVPRPNVPGVDERFWEDPEIIRRSTLEFLSDYPEEIKEMIEIADTNSLSFTHLRYRAPWDLLTGTFCKGRVTVAGDAMHIMGPFLGQGGSAGLEDAVVLARNLGQVGLKRVEEAFNLYAKERRMRLVRLSLQTFLTGVLLGTSSSVKKLICIVFLFLLFRDPDVHVDYNCGRL